MKHSSAYEELGAKWQAASHPITDRWPPRRLSRWDATTLPLHGHADTDESSMQCLPPVRPFRQKAGHGYSEPLIGSQTGSLSFARKWPRHHGGPCSERGSVDCCPRRLRPAAMDSFVLRMLFARFRTQRLRCAPKSSELLWHTGLPITASSLTRRTSWVHSISAMRSSAFRSSSAERRDRECPERSISGCCKHIGRSSPRL